MHGITVLCLSCCILYSLCFSDFWHCNSYILQQMFTLYYFVSLVFTVYVVLTSTPGINLTLVNHKGTPLDIVGSDHNTLLHYACFERNSTLAELLVRNGADVMKPNTYGDAPIHIACKCSRLACYHPLPLSACVLHFDLEDSQQLAVTPTSCLHIILLPTEYNSGSSCL